VFATLTPQHEVGLSGTIVLNNVVPGSVWQGFGYFTLAGVLTEAELTWHCYQQLTLQLTPNCSRYLPNTVNCLPVSCLPACPFAVLFQFVLGSAIQNPEPPPMWFSEGCGCETPEICTVLITISD
jgi:hypothetical protein